MTAADVDRAWKSKAQPLLFAESDEWYTPADVIKAARAVLGVIDPDPASSAAANETVGAATYFDAEADGLAQEWRGRVWCNPPFSLAGRFAERALTNYLAACRT